MRISYDDFSQSQNKNQNSSNQDSYTKYIKYFSLKDDGDEAIVRFIYDNPNQFDILNVHDVKVGQYTNHFNCIRNPKEPVDNCPLCKANLPLRCNFFIKLIQYTNDNGNISAEARVWQRSTNYIKLIKSLMDEYSPLCDYIFKIKRVGKAGDKNTMYNIIPCNPNIYTSEVYKKDFSSFDDYEVLGGTVQDKNYEELTSLLNKETLPKPQIKSTPVEKGYPQEASRRQYASNFENNGNQFTPRRY